MSDDVFYLTTPIYYPNDDPHLGHAYTTVAADFICRFRRLQGRKVHFLTGTDEHGLKLARAAEANGMSPKQWVDHILPKWTDVWTALDISFDDFIRTTEERHETAVQKFAQTLHDRGEIYLGTYEGLYCVACEAYYVPEELVDGKCPIHGTVPERVEEENYFFRLSRYADRLLDMWEREPWRVQPDSRRKEVMGKVRQGLQDLSMSRVSFEWGIPVPWDPKHVIYVWIDALQNYITAIGYGRDEATFKRIWPADVHLIGKDILWFHSVIWPAMLMALDLPQPKTVFAHGFLQVGGEKMSKTRLTGIAPQDLISTFGADGYRYYFMREINFGNDGEFSWESMIARYNSDLANDFGNLVSRVLSMVNRYLDGIVPRPPEDHELEDADEDLMAVQGETFIEMEKAIDALRLDGALKACWRFVRKANAYVEEVAPWALAKDETKGRRLKVVLYMLTDALRLMAAMIAPIMPETAEKLWRRLGLTGSTSEVNYGDDLLWRMTKEGTHVETGTALFPRLEEDSPVA
jgi:methionyl-tRNA synthetase